MWDLFLKNYQNKYTTYTTTYIYKYILSVYEMLSQKKKEYYIAYLLLHQILFLVKTVQKFLQFAIFKFKFQ